MAFEDAGYAVHLATRRDEAKVFQEDVAKVDTLEVKLGSFVKLSAVGFMLDTGATPLVTYTQDDPTDADLTDLANK